MKFLLAAVNAKYIHSNLALYDLRAYCRDFKENIELAEYTINDTVDHILEDIFQREPDAVAFSCYIWNIVLIEQLADELCKVLPDTKLWLGGPEASYRAAELLGRHPCLSGIMIGEGERTFYQLLEHYVSGIRELSSVQNLACRGKDGIFYTQVGEMVALSEVPFPYKDMTDFRNRIVYYESSRGCPFSCSYCLSSVDKKLRFRELSMVKKELQFFLDQKVRQVKFVDRTFNVWKEHAVEIWRYLFEHDNGITNFHFEIAADLLEEDELLLLGRMRRGLVQLEIGVQSANSRTFKEIHRTMQLDKVRYVVDRLRGGRNIHLHLDLIAGLPYEDYNSFCQSFNTIYQMEPDQLQLGFLKVLPGTYMAEEAERYGMVFRSMPTYEVLYTRWISYKELLRLKGVEEMVEVYYNSAQFTSSVRKLLPYFKSPYDMYDGMAEYYRQEGLTNRKLNRLERYEILLAFAENYMTEREKGQFRECLCYDLYLRENWKSRIDFAQNTEKYKEERKTFYKVEARRHHYLPDYVECDGKQLARLTQLEYFCYNPLTGSEQEVFLLFDYRNRDPFSYAAAVTQIQKGELYAYIGI